MRRKTYQDLFVFFQSFLIAATSIIATHGQNKLH